MPQSFQIGYILFIEKNKTTTEEYWETKGQNYRNAPFLQVYGKEEKPCPICGKVFCRMVMVGGSRTFGPNSQKDNKKWEM